MKKKLLTIMLAVIAALCFSACFVACGNEDDPKPTPTVTTYTVTVEASENGSVSASATTVKKGGSVTLTISPDEGYELDELTVNGTAVEVTGTFYTVSNVQSDVTVGATFKAQAPTEQKVTVTFDGETPTSKEVTVGQAYGELPVLESTPGNRFVGWFTEETGGTRVTATTVVTATADHTLYPRFTDKLLVTFDYGLGTGEEETRDVSKDEAIGELPTATAPANSVFYGWFVGDTEVTAEYTVTDDVTVTASFLTVSLSLKSGSSDIAVAGLSSGDITPEIEVSVTLDGEPSVISVTVETTDAETATIDENKITALKDGSVYVIAMYNGAEIARTSFTIGCYVREGYTTVSNKDELFAIHNDVAGKYLLINDIDCNSAALADADDNGIFGNFSGILDGMGHKVYNALAHPSRWDQGAFLSVAADGVVRNIAFTQMWTYTGKCANNGFFGKVYGTVENVFLDLHYMYADRQDTQTGYGALAAYLYNGSSLKNCVVNFNAGDVPLDYVGGIAYNIGQWGSHVENCFVVTNNLSITSNLDGLYYKEGGDGVAAAETTNSAARKYLVQLINSDEVDITKLGGEWSIKDGALYFFGKKVIEATPEYIINTQGDEEIIYRDLEEEDKAQLLYNVSFIHDGEPMEGIPEGVITSSTNPDVAELVYDEDMEIFYLDNKGAGVTNITVKVGKYSATFKLTLTQLIGITSAEEFKTKIASDPAGMFELDNDIDFEGEELTAAIVESFTGSLNGNNYAIKNFVLSGGENGGLFKTLNGTVKNVAFVNVMSADEDNRGGLFVNVGNNAVIENVFIDYVMQADGSDGDTAAGPIAGKLNAATINNVFVNLRFADGLDIAALENVGALVGDAATSSSRVTNVKVLVNGADGLNIAAVNASNCSGWTSCNQFASYVEFFAGNDKAVFTEENGWTLDETGVTFGENKVYDAPEYIVVPDKNSVAVEFIEEETQPFALDVTVLHYSTAMGEYPETLTAISSDDEIATVAIVDGAITVTPLAIGNIVITVSVGDYAAEIAVSLLPPVQLDLAYAGGATLNLDYEFAGKIVDIAITAATEDGEAAEIPATVKLTTTDETIAKFVYDEQSKSIKVQLNAAGTVTLTAQVRDGAAVSLNVTVEQIFHISTPDEFVDKMLANRAVRIIDGKEVQTVHGHYVLDNDIDWSTRYFGWVMIDNADWLPIAPAFDGILDGQGYAMRNMVLLDGNNGGMIVRLLGTVKNIAFVNVTGQSGNNFGGLFNMLDTGSTVENIYLDYLMQGNGTCADNDAGPLSGTIYGATIKNIIINLRFKDSMDLTNLTKLGAVVGNTNAWAVQPSNIKVLVNGIAADVLSASSAGPADVDVNNATRIFDNYADLFASDTSAFTAENGWKIEASGITLGHNKVLTVEVEEPAPESEE